jgi:hypothetical protein
MIDAAKTGMFILFLLIPVIHLNAWPVPDTGQTTCYNNTVEIPCPSPGDAFYGQDATYAINPPSYTKLDAAGSPLPDLATVWVMLRDNVSGLVWESKTNDGSIHDAFRNFFTWCDRTTPANGTAQGTCGSGSGAASTDTGAFIQALNEARFGTHSDWRMPAMQELMMLVDRGRAGPAVNPDFFANLGWSYYWSSAANADVSDQAWCVVFNEGNAVNDVMSNSNAVRAVRGAALAHRYIDNGDGTVSDTATGLMWQKETDDATNWQTALHSAATLSLGGYDDWRLPNINEMLSLVDYGAYSPAINVAFPVAAASNYWSSTTYAGNPETAWYINFNDGFVSHSEKLNAFSMRAVRGGQPRLSGHLDISAPAQSARWDVGKQKAIIWDTAGIGGDVQITLSRQGGKPGTFLEIIAESVPNNGSWNWTVTGPESVNCVLRIDPMDQPGGTTQGLFSIMTIIPGDVNDDRVVDLIDLMLVIRGMSKMTLPDQLYNVDADVNSDGKMGLPEAVFILQALAGMR